MAETDSAQYPYMYRAITTKRWYDAKLKKVDSAAFTLKVKKAETGISVLKDVTACSQAVCTAELRDCFGELVLQTDAARALGLEVMDDDPDSEDYSANHAEIVGIPVLPGTPEDKRRAEDFATDLAELATLHFDRFRKYV